MISTTRDDPAYSPNLPPGNTETGTNSGDVVKAMIAESADGGKSWTEAAVST